MSFKVINAQAACELLEAGKAKVVDIRDPQSYQQSCIKGAIHLDNNSVADFVASADKKQPLIVVCYHGMSSQNAAQFLSDQGFEEVYSLEGGFEFWKTCQPDWCH
ncbi:thiosulfate sulfurtransferase GlpE [Marinospirillum perlucidum]|uniref:thiosulfate sulfurtransferase GlpE n=1 Tax=Marinospirillum perlucidum TaxID=1982602 RepID=UPI000DF291E0|nr:thiosulfate sulfurtransferase GlpE [Marinospirillum perlucidum]